MVYLIFGSLHNTNIMSDNTKSLNYHIARDYKSKKLNLFYMDECHPFRDEVKLKFLNDTLELYHNFLMPKEFSDLRIHEISDTLAVIRQPDIEAQILYIKKSDWLSFDNHDTIFALGYQLKYRSIPNWLDRKLNNNVSWGKKYNNRVIYAFVQE